MMQGIDSSHILNTFHFILNASCLCRRFEAKTNIYRGKAAIYVFRPISTRSPTHTVSGSRLFLPIEYWLLVSSRSHNQLWGKFSWWWIQLLITMTLICPNTSRALFGSPSASSFSARFRLPSKLLAEDFKIASIIFPRYLLESFSLIVSSLALRAFSIWIFCLLSKTLIMSHFGVSYYQKRIHNIVTYAGR